MKKVLTFIILLVQVLFANLIIAGASENPLVGLLSGFDVPSIMEYIHTLPTPEANTEENPLEALQRIEKQHKRNRRGDKNGRGESPSGGDGRTYQNLPKNKPNFPQSNH